MCADEIDWAERCGAAADQKGKLKKKEGKREKREVGVRKQTVKGEWERG